MKTIHTIHEYNPSTYRTKSGKDAPRKHVTRREEPMKYKLSWGDQSFDGPHMVVHGDQPYGIAIDEFDKTHNSVAGQDLYIKSAKVRAVQLTETAEVVSIVKGREESRSEGPAGSWAVENPGGEVYVVPDEEFRSKYDLVK